jgi:small subunit ribosomal protein S8
MTDPIADLLTRIRNAHGARHGSVDVPNSKMKAEIAKILREEGFIKDFTVDDGPVQGTLRIELKYGRGGESAITGLQRVSKPGRRVYCGKEDIPKVLDGLGISIISTSRGVKTGTACRELGVGGEVLCNIW